MAGKLAIIGASGKCGGATLNALLENSLIPASQIVTLTTSQPGDEKWTALSSKGVEVRHASFEDPASMEKGLQGISRLFLVSSPRIKLDFNEAPHGQGREKDHFVAIDAARKSGVKHVYYTSLAFQNPSKSRVMKAHERTEAYLKGLSDIDWTIIREGLYNESWPLYLGHYKIGADGRSEIVVAGDGPICWTSIPDLGLASALVLAAPAEQYVGKTFYLSQTKSPKTLKEIADMVSAATGKKLTLKVVPRSEHEEHHIGRGLDEGHIRWWAKSYDAVKDGECLITDTTLEDLLSSKGRTPKPVEQTIREMLGVA
ncbi:NAD(P)-binding protein [Rhizodiscina lignyota]|uniref:NAD(P)-binding protein n=1 Tax=Rhizodiscina lignyota TaxID=1504668 RepID=A0A9P4ICC1_9PEZI|nr:NAD(P)-binding protein [Rhizodiscina lignyota]